MRTVLLFLGVSLAFAEKHSLQYRYTMVSGPESADRPSFTAEGRVDGVRFLQFDSRSSEAMPKTDWIRQNEEYWSGETEGLRRRHQRYTHIISVAQQRFNQSAGVHTFQEMYGCEFDDQTGETSGFLMDGYDGEDLLYLDLKEMRFVSPVPQAFMTAVKWNNNRALLEQDKHYFSWVCVEWLQKYLHLLKSSLKQKVSPPHVSVLRSSSSSSSSPPLTCHATGFYPPLVMISWYKDGKEVHEDVSLGDLLPNEDGTFQKSSSLSVSPEEQQKHSFSCVVEHQGKRVEEREIRSNSGAGDSAGIIIGVGVGAAVLLILVTGAVAWCVIQKKRGFKPVSGSDDGSTSSAHTIPKA